ncbi:hypothetical protein [Comamonas aquatica]|uniref:hypothetical protein n=1 Tax=Comamonas aquatica TaxID=225991 RepID=UPI0024478C50|nr:hypothetical protein [Comamonas aquatica]MDH0494708.1 hypothetical protein [Comamonas aquatica]
MFNFPKCPKCNSTLPIATGVCAQCPQSSPPGHQDLDASLAAPAQVDQVGGTITCAACGSTNIYSYPYTCEFCQCVCDDCDSPLNADGSVWVEKQPSLPVDVPESETLWLFLTKGYSLNYIRESLVCGIPHLEAEARMLSDRAHKNWAQIRSEVGA